MVMRKIWKTLGIISMLAMLTVSVGCGNGTDKKANSEANTTEKKVVRVAFTNYYVPYDFVNQAGEPDGFEVQVMKEVEKLLPQYQFKFEPTSDDDLLIGVESGKYDVGIKGVWQTEARKTKFIFPKNNIAASVIGLTFRKSDADKIKDMDSFAKIGGKLVPIAPQNAQYAVVEDYNKKHPDTPIKLLPSESFQVADAYTWVLEGRYDAFFDIELAYKNNVVNDKGTYHKFNDQLAYVRYNAIPTYPIFNKKDQEFADAYDKAIEQLTQSGKIKELEQKYFGEDLLQLVKK
ncbi:transporter substrate-binding domain-containing protein [Propionispora vibrioides]|uniref:transporter substrate-binding domain-containing protein n=1 Tax=Propionispora vibrioides TaxID=112903 RepID=UPI003F6DC64C